MNISLSWGDRGKTLLIITLCPGWTWEELYIALHLQEHWVRSVDHYVDVILDCANAGTLPDSEKKYLYQIVAEFNDVRPGVMVLVGAGTTLRPLMEAITYIRNPKAGKRPFVLARSLDQALRLLPARH